MTDLQLRLQEAEELSVAEKAAVELSPNEQLFVRARTLAARKKAIEQEEKSLKAAIRALVREGELVGSEQVGGFYDVDTSIRTSFDFKSALADGVLTRDAAQPYLKSTSVETLRFKALEKSNV